ncbi:hypothetical protein RIF29_39323 [Crotalaria pallida]|uniref:Uncharacterized protein n=1 Tax=Crotalaria pallida TaxID=3830 RepID=A0AAN9HMD5_CROPI
MLSPSANSSLWIGVGTDAGVGVGIGAGVGASAGTSSGARARGGIGPDASASGAGGAWRALLKLGCTGLEISCVSGLIWFSKNCLRMTALQ